jgi:hypothetical protein
LEHEVDGVGGIGNKGEEEYGKYCHAAGVSALSILGPGRFVDEVELLVFKSVGTLFLELMRGIRINVVHCFVI